MASLQPASVLAGRGIALKTGVFVRFSARHAADRHSTPLPALVCGAVDGAARKLALRICTPVRRKAAHRRAVLVRLIRLLLRRYYSRIGVKKRSYSFIF
jgi:predicted nucleic acid-binding protein